MRGSTAHRSLPPASHRPDTSTSWDTLSPPPLPPTASDSGYRLPARWERQGCGQAGIALIPAEIINAPRSEGVLSEETAGAASLQSLILDLNRISSHLWFETESSAELPTTGDGRKGA